MKKITSISQQKKNKNRLNVFLDDEFAFGMDKYVFLSQRLKIGDEVDEERLREIVFLSNLRDGFDKAATYLSASPRSEKEIREYLTDKEFSQEEVEAIVEKLLSYGYINDLEYAKLFVESYKKRCGLRLMSFKLGEKGVASEIVLQVLPKSDEEAAVMLAKKYIKESTTWQKLSNYLGGKGFSSDGIRAACRLLEER